MNLLPLVKSGFSLLPDLKDGWRPQPKDCPAPIPIRYGSLDLSKLDSKLNLEANSEFPILVYSGYRPNDSLTMHKEFLLTFKPSLRLGVSKSDYPF
jgi:hypothetical protein